VLPVTSDSEPPAAVALVAPDPHLSIILSRASQLRTSLELTTARASLRKSPKATDRFEDALDNRTLMLMPK
uniref:DUF4140 domain-containing protein n=1 Tax=Macrostomum lignano TaxID=282301 RepID=A0A1I8HK64_9PLAT